MSPKYTVYGNDDFDRKIESDLQNIRNTILTLFPEKDISAIILGGGYGRGEGGVVVKNGKMCLYNDYDMFMITNNISYKKKKEYQEKIFKASEELTEKIGIDVDFGPLKNKNELKKMPFTLMYYELKKGHKVIYGNKNSLRYLPDYDINKIPKDEMLNYMLNRGVGLFLAYQKITKTKNSETDLEFVERNIYKALMACGDIFLLFEEKYNYLYTARMQSMKILKNNEIIQDRNFLKYYEDSINYKLHPVNKFDHLDVKLEYTLKVFEKFYLYAFSEYWQRNIPSFDVYYPMLSQEAVPKCRNIKNLLKNNLLNIKEVGCKNFSFKFSMNYPRYRLFFALPYFLFNCEIKDVILRKVLGIDRNLSKRDKIKRFLLLWNRFN